MSVRAGRSLLPIAALLTGLTLLQPAVSAEPRRQVLQPKVSKVNVVQPKVTGNYEQLIEIQQQALDQALLKAKSAANDMQKIRNVIKKYEVEAEIKKQEKEAQEAAAGWVAAEPAKAEESLRSLEEGREAVEAVP